MSASLGRASRRLDGQWW